MSDIQFSDKLFSDKKRREGTTENDIESVWLRRRSGFTGFSRLVNVLSRCEEVSDQTKAHYEVYDAPMRPSFPINMMNFLLKNHVRRCPSSPSFALSKVRVRSSGSLHNYLLPRFFVEIFNFCSSD